MTWEQALQLTNLFLIPAMLYLVRLEGRLVKLEVKLATVLAIIAERAGIDLSNMEV